MGNFFENKIQHNEILFRFARGKSILEGNEIHPYHEILYFMKGEGKFYSDDFNTDLRENMLFIIPKNTYHCFSITDQNSYTRMVLNFPELNNVTNIKILSEKKAAILTPKNKDIEFILKKICSALASADEEIQKRNLLYGAFLMLLAEISQKEDCILPNISAEKKQLISKCISYIERNLSSRLTIEKTANELSISSSTLSQSFKKELGISFYKYVTEKRLSHANTLIEKGYLPTKIYSECGYNDYVTFYKAYVKMFGFPPSYNS